MADSLQEGSTDVGGGQNGIVESDKDVAADPVKDPTTLSTGAGKTQKETISENKQLMDSGYDEPFLKKADPTPSEETGDIKETDLKLPPSDMSTGPIVEDKKEEELADHEGQAPAAGLNEDDVNQKQDIKIEESPSLEPPPSQTEDTHKLPAEEAVVSGDVNTSPETLPSPEEMPTDTVPEEKAQQPHATTTETETKGEESKEPPAAESTAGESHEQATEIPSKQETPQDTISTSSLEQKELILPQAAPTAEDLQTPPEVAQSEETGPVSLSEETPTFSEPDSKQEEAIQEKSPEMSVSESSAKEPQEQVVDISPTPELTQETVSTLPPEQKEQISPQSEAPLSTTPDESKEPPPATVEDPVLSESNDKQEDTIPETSKEVSVSEPAPKVEEVQVQEIAPSHELPQQTMTMPPAEQKELVSPQSAPSTEEPQHVLEQSSEMVESDVSQESIEIKEQQALTASPPEQEQLPVSQEETTVSDQEPVPPERIENATSQEVETSEIQTVSSHGPPELKEEQQSQSPPRTFSPESQSSPHIESALQTGSSPQTPSPVQESLDMWDASPNQVPSPPQTHSPEPPDLGSSEVHSLPPVQTPPYVSSPESQRDTVEERQEVVEEVIIDSDTRQGLESTHVSVNMEPTEELFQESSVEFPHDYTSSDVRPVYEEFYEEVYEEEEKTVGTGPVEAKKVIQIAQDTSILLDQFEENGKLSKVSAYFANKNIVRFQVWRPNGKELEFYLVFEAEVDSTDMGLGAKDVPVILEATVQKGDRLALCSRGGSLPVGYAETKEEKEFVCRKSSGDFEKKKFKYNFSVSAAYLVPTKG